MAGGTAFRKGVSLVEWPRGGDLDSDEDAGRSSLGKRKRERTKQGDEHAFAGVKAAEKDEEARHVRSEDNIAFPQQVQESSMGYNPPKEMDQKQQKRSKKEKRQTQEHHPAS